MNEKIMRQQIKTLLEGRQAHMSLFDAVSDFPQKEINAKAPNIEYSFWHLLEHIQRTQADILEFVKSPNYKEKEWPKDYWPDYNSTATKKDWEKTIDLSKKDLKELIVILENPKTNLEEKIPWGDGQTYLREFLLAADHNAYHLGEFAILRQVCDNWEK